jgi:hypothetical protein
MNGYTRRTSQHYDTKFVIYRSSCLLPYTPHLRFRNRANMLALRLVSLSESDLRMKVPFYMSYRSLENFAILLELYLAAELSARYSRPI